MGAAAALGPIAAACGSSGGTAASSSASAAGTPNKGGDLMVGIVGGSAKDTADPHIGSYEPDIAIQYIMYEGLTNWDFDMGLRTCWPRPSSPTPTVPSGRSSCGTGCCGTTANPSPPTTSSTPWTASSIPKDPKVAAAALTGVAPGGTKKIDNLTVEFTPHDAERPAGRVSC